LLFFGRPATPSKKERVTHVAMYIGNEQFIHASGKVRINSMDNASPGFIRSYPPRFVRAVRVTGNVNGNGIEYLKDNKFYKEIIN
jgi:cell wall-associated NlpC family hydrolase